jgi:micrococcal nuclease
MVTRIVDGDTVHCNAIGSVRLIGIDTPELSQAPCGANARDALSAMIPIGTRTQLERDVTLKDQYGRTLGYIWHAGQMVNWRMVREGWAVLATYPPNVQYVDSIRVAEQRARADSLGLWRTSGFACRPEARRQGRC